MSSYERELRLAEYATLRAELQQGKQYIFERPLVIMLAAAVVASQMTGNPALILLPLAAVGVLFFNLAFTVNRLSSMARIIAYIGVVLEGESPVHWIGWETSLEKSRIWMNAHPPRLEEGSKVYVHNRLPFGLFRDDLMSDEVRDRMDSSDRFDSNRFYDHLLWFHLAGIIAAVGGSVYLAATTTSWESILFCCLTGVLAGVIALAACGGPYRPRGPTIGVEKQRATWRAVFDVASPERD